MNEEKKEREMEFDLPVETLEQIEELAAHFGTTKSHIIELAMDRLWNRKQEESPLE